MSALSPTEEVERDFRQRVSEHAWRHCYAIHFLLKGGNLVALWRQSGHEMLEIVKTYAHFIDQDAEEEQRQFFPADDVEIEPST